MHSTALIDVQERLSAHAHVVQTDPKAFIFVQFMSKNDYLLMLMCPDKSKGIYYLCAVLDEQSCHEQLLKHEGQSCAFCVQKLSNATCGLFQQVKLFYAKVLCVGSWRTHLYLSHPSAVGF